MTEVRHKENTVQNESVQKSGKCGRHNSGFLRIRESGRLHTSRRQFSSGGHVPRRDRGGSYMHIHLPQCIELCISFLDMCSTYIKSKSVGGNFHQGPLPPSTMVLATKKDVEKQQLLQHDGSRGEMLLNACQCINEA